MKHLFFLLLLATSLVAIWYAFQGRMQGRFCVASGGPAAPTPAPAAYARAPETDPVGTVHRVVSSGQHLGHSTAGALERMSGSQP
jgi:hypothetical protein